MSFETVLIANRGEIALRVIEACRELGLRSVVVYSKADASMPYLGLADASVCIGPPQPAKSYLNVASIISAVELTGADAIHPGYGFLAEDPHFVEVCEEHGLVFIGPSVETMRLVGDKMAAREAVAAAGVPVLPGALAPTDPEALLGAAEEIGCPLLVKALYGGGGRGMRLVASLDDLEAAAASARAEAKAACGNDGLYLEKAVDDPRHVEVQIFADARGAVVHLGERECSIQRRHQKMIEESPAPSLDEGLRRRLHAAAARAAEATGYRTAGTVEFLGHAIECRVTAEDPARRFAPSSGTLRLRQLPGGNGVRLDTAVFDGMPVSQHYDSLLAKVISWGEDREEARVRMATALERFRVSGVTTTAGFLRRVVDDPAFRRGEITTGFVDRMLGRG
jgi:acetyl/propionyl-CoA carboxylase alpha subunit